MAKDSFSFKLLIVADESEQIRELSSKLAQQGFICAITSDIENAIEQAAEEEPDLVLVAMDGLLPGSEAWHLPQRVKRGRHLPVIALLSREALGNLDSIAIVDDFVVKPWDASEVAARAKRVLAKVKGLDAGELIRCGDLVIDIVNCEVSLSGSLVALTFKEYELLKFLAKSKGRVFTRENLLNKVWGYEYYGGDRTVDVHIRRLRSKIEDSDHTFIETVRNIGYRFKKDV